MGWIFMGIFSTVITPFIMFWVLYFNVLPQDGMTKEEAQEELMRRLWRSGRFWLWAIYSTIIITFVTMAYSN